MERFECYHGTSAESCEKILAENHFDSSTKEDDWAGSGIYYFIDLHGASVAVKNAKKWAQYKKKFLNRAVLKSKVNIDSDYLLDLCNSQYQNEFHRFRMGLFEEACRKAERQNIQLKQEYLDLKMLDCTAINKMCEHGEFFAVIRQCYIRCLAYTHSKVYKYPNSAISNCSIFCLRNESFIEETERVNE